MNTIIIWSKKIKKNFMIISKSVEADLASYIFRFQSRNNVHLFGGGGGGGGETWVGCTTT